MLQGNLLKGIDDKIVRWQGFRMLVEPFVYFCLHNYVLFSVTHFQLSKGLEIFCNTQWLEQLSIPFDKLHQVNVYGSRFNSLSERRIKLGHVLDAILFSSLAMSWSALLFVLLRKTCNRNCIASLYIFPNKPGYTFCSN